MPFFEWSNQNIRIDDTHVSLQDNEKTRIWPLISRVRHLIKSEGAILSRYYPQIERTRFLISDEGPPGYTVPFFRVVMIERECALNLPPPTKSDPMDKVILHELAHLVLCYQSFSHIFQKYSKYFDIVTEGIHRWSDGDLNLQSIDIDKRELRNVASQGFLSRGPRVGRKRTITEYQKFLEHYFNIAQQLIKGYHSLRCLYLLETNTPPRKRSHSLQIRERDPSPTIDKKIRQLYLDVRNRELLDRNLHSPDVFKFGLLSLGCLLGSYFNLRMDSDICTRKRRSLMEEGVCTYLACKIEGLNISQNRESIDTSPGNASQAMKLERIWGDDYEQLLEALHQGTRVPFLYSRKQQTM